MSNFVESFANRSVTSDQTFSEAIFKDSRAEVYVKKFLNCHFDGLFNVDAPDRKINFENCVFDDSIEKVILNAKSSGSVTFKNCTIKKDLHLGIGRDISMTNTSIGGVLRVADSLNGQIIIENDSNDNSTIEKIDFGNLNGCFNLELTRLKVKTICFTKWIPKKVKFLEGYYTNVIMNGVHHFENLEIFGSETNVNIPIKIDNLQLSSLNLKGYVLLKVAVIGELDISGFNLQEGSFRIQTITVKKIARIEQSNLRGVQFNDVNFHSAKLILDWTFLSDAQFSNIIWPKGHLIDSEMEEETKAKKILLLRAKTEVYRQLKKVSLNESNNIEALKFYRNEMATYWERVKLDKTETWANRFLIRVNKVTSNFGQSYWYPIWWMLGFHFLLCSSVWILEANANGWLWDYSKLDIALGLKEYFTWLIPIYDVPETWLSASVIIGVFMRIFSGFFIYHIIKATRKFGKV